MSQSKSSLDQTALGSEAPPPADVSARAALEPMDPLLTSIQPGGGVVIQLELLWGRFRRWYLRTFRRGYVERMRALRQGDENRCPHPVLDPRDLKFFRNQGGYHWDPQDDPFTWRDRLPFARVGLAELLLFTVTCFTVAAVCGSLLFAGQWSLPVRIVLGVASFAALVIAALIIWFFRDPHRRIPLEPGLVVSPADGVVVTVERIDYDEFVDGPAVLIGIFLSIFNVHINRMPVAGRVLGLRYKRGKFLNALKPESARENEQLAIRLESTEGPVRRMIVRQITGAIARRIVCWLKPGDELQRGEQFGMIKLGSRTELVLPWEESLEVVVKPGQPVKAGATVVAEYRENS